MSTSYNYQVTNCNIPLIVPKDSLVFVRQSIFNLLSVLSAAVADSNCLVCLKDIRAAIRFASRIVPCGFSDVELHDADIFSYDDSED